MAISPEQWASDLGAALSQLAPLGPSSRFRPPDFLACLPPGYQEETSPQDAACDYLALARLVQDGVPPGTSSQLAVAPAGPGAPGDFRLRRTGLTRVELSSFLPVLESFGLAAVESVPWRFALPGAGPEAFLDDIGLRVGMPVGGSGPVAADFADRFVEAVEAVLAGHATQTGLNRLVVGAGLGWREVNLLSAYRDYRQVVGGLHALERADAMTEALAAFPKAACAVVSLFKSRLVPPGPGDERQAREEMAATLAEVPDLAHFEALSELVGLVEATTRSNWALGSGTVAVKLSGQEVGFLPAPRPAAEVYVWSPWFEALHLRFGLVARGGIRWSDRQSDMRAEVLGLARAQVKKNSLIVPTGAKGAFRLRSDARPGYGAVGATQAGSSRAERGKEAYQAFVSAMLEVTDNISEGKVSRPDGLRCLDGDDPYLVVAPDKGTAAFSDLANALSLKRQFWLGDAFASGGSHGYDHKALGITARGAWLAVRRHFRALGMDASTDALRVVGVGDMSGDVFGNGMLQSEALHLVAAFDHRHIFVDPSPVPATAFAERLRLSRLPGSSWEDYDMRAASQGAGVWPRQAKHVELSSEAAAALGLPPGTAMSPMSPPELVKAVLRAPVDLIFFGGVGTFVKAPGEGDADVDDEANDDVRVTSDQLRARVVAEGANLAVTQRARVSYSRRGGRVNADFVDNAAGVAMSDREVNLKILLGLPGVDLAATGRDEILREAEGGAASSVLAAVEGSLVALDLAAATSAVQLPAWELLMSSLQESGLLDAEVECLPGSEELARRRQAGAGLTRPELAVLLSYARSAVARAVEASRLVEDRSLATCALRYFPSPMRSRFAGVVPSHPLFAQLVCSELANEVVHWMGGTWANEVAAELGRPLWAVAGGYWAAAQVLEAGQWGGDVAAGRSMSLETESALRLSVSRAIGRLARWYVRHDDCSAPADIVDRDKPLCAELEALAADGARPEAQPAGPGLTGAPAELSARAERLGALAGLAELAWAARATSRSLAEVVAAHRLVEAGLALPSLSRQLERWPAPPRWSRWELHCLADDVAEVRARALAGALTARPELAPEMAVQGWLAPREAAVSRAVALAGELRRSDPPDLALAWVALRALDEAVGSSR